MTELEVWFTSLFLYWMDDRKTHYLPSHLSPEVVILNRFMFNCFISLLLHIVVTLIMMSYLQIKALFKKFYFFSVPRFIVYMPHPVLHAIRALLSTHHQAHLPSTLTPQNPQFVSQSPQSLMVYLSLWFPPTHFSSPSPNVFCVIPYAPQVSENIW